MNSIENLCKRCQHAIAHTRVLCDEAQNEVSFNQQLRELSSAKREMRISWLLMSQMQIALANDVFYIADDEFFSLE
jgi:hypothetical protein